MLLSENFNFAILCLTAIVSCCVAFTAWIRRDEAPATQPFTGLMGAIALYASIAAINSAITSPSAIVVGAILETLCSTAVTALFFIFTLRFTCRNTWLTRKRIGLIWAVPLFNMGLVAANPLHQWIWADIIPVEGSHSLWFQQGPAYIWLAAWFYVYVLTGALLVAREALKPVDLYRQQAITVIVSTLPPLVVGTLYVFDWVPPGLSLLPMSFLATGLIYFTSLFRFRLFDLLPIARDTLIENVSDSVFVLDANDRVIDMNPSAWEFTHRMGAAAAALGNARRTRLLGQPVNKVLDRWPSLLRHCTRKENTEALITICHRPPIHINLRMYLLYGDKAARPSILHRKPTGKLVMLRDMTTLYQGQIELMKTNQLQQKTQARLESSNRKLKKRILEIEALQEQLHEMAVRDRLTKLFNRHYFEEALLAEFTKARRSGSPLSIILFDIDHFKRINDTYGHQAGDQALRIFAELIQEKIRTSDIACRYGGEEFILAMPGMTLEEAHQRAEKIRQAFKSTVIDYKGQQIQATISGGVGALPDYEGSQDGLISLVDKALYAAKKAGRDRIFPIRLDNIPYSHLTQTNPIHSSNQPN